MSASSLWVTWGTLSQDRCSAGPDSRWMRDSGRVSTGPNFEKSCAGTSGMPPWAARAGAAGRAADRRDHVLLEDPALGAGPGQRVEVKAELAGQPAHARPGVYAVEVRGRPSRRRGHRRPALSWGSYRGHRGRRGHRSDRSRRRGRRRRGCRSHLGLLGRFLLLVQWRRFDVGAASVEQQDRGPPADHVADLDPQLADRARGRRRDVHGGLVRFQGDQRVLVADHVAGRDVDLDDRHVGEVAEVRNTDFSRGGHSCSLTDTTH